MELTKVDVQPEFSDEIKEAKTPEEKVILLQKYGLMEPKLTLEEKIIIHDEHVHSLGYYGFAGETLSETLPESEAVNGN